MKMNQALLKKRLKSSRYDANQFINIKMIYDNFADEISDVFPELHAIPSCDTTLYKISVEKFPFIRKVCKDSEVDLQRCSYKKVS